MKRPGELIGRLTMIATAIVLGWWACRCFVGFAGGTRPAGPSEKIFAFACVLLLGSVTLIGLAVAPSRIVALLEGVHGNPGEEPDDDYDFGDDD